MKTLELECPNCGAALSLDPGFAGGVCRCSACATLMTVPDDPSRQRAEALERPEAPGQPARPGPGGRSSKRSAAQPSAPPPGQYRTASGKVVTVKAGQKIPTASRAKAAKAVTTAVFALVLLVVLGFVGAAIYIVMQPPAQEATGPTETFVYDPAANPYAVPEPNVFGLPLAERTVVALDLSGVSAEAWDAARPLLEDALSRSSRAIRLNVVVWDEAGGARGLVGDDPQRLGTFDAADATARLRGLQPRDPGGQRPLAELAALVGDQRPGQVIVVSGRDVGREEADAFAAGLSEGVRLDVVMLDGDSGALDRLTRDRGGVYRVLDPDRELTLWGRP